MVQRKRRRRPASEATAYALDLRAVGAGESFQIRTLSDSHPGLLVHFKGRSWPCRGEDCPAAIHSILPTWKGYEPVEEWDPANRLWLPCVLEVTEHLELHFRGRYKRGQVWHVSRLPNDRNRHAPVEGELLQELDPAELPPEFSMAAVLWTVYHQPVNLTVANPLPPRTMVTPSRGAPPGVAGAVPQSPAEKTTYQSLAERMRNGPPVPSGNGDGAGH